MFLCLRATFAIKVGSPIKAIYIDWHLNWNAPQQSLLSAVADGYNVIIISFYLSSGSAADFAQAWAALDAGTKQSAISSAHSSGAVVTVSLGGSTDSPYDKNAFNLGVQVANWAQSQYLDGVDFDLENLQPGFKAGSMSDSQTVTWISDLTSGTHSILGDGGVISHAPQAPYFGPLGYANTWTGPTGGYTSVYQKVGQYITYFNMQFYNQGATCYVDYAGLFLKSCNTFLYTSVLEIANGSIPLNKIVVGKPVTSADAGSGYVDPNSLHNFFQQAKSQLGWNAGVMGWVWNDPTTLANWIKAIYGGGGTSSGTASNTVTAASASSGPPPTSSSSSSSGPPSTSGGTSGGSCAGKPQGMFCVNATAFEWCPQNIVQSCAPGTKCDQQGNSINCD